MRTPHLNESDSQPEAQLLADESDREVYHDAPSDFGEDLDRLTGHALADHGLTGFQDAPSHLRDAGHYAPSPAGREPFEAHAAESEEDVFHDALTELSGEGGELPAPAQAGREPTEIFEALSDLIAQDPRALFQDHPRQLDTVSDISSVDDVHPAGAPNRINAAENSSTSANPRAQGDVPPPPSEPRQRFFSTSISPHPFLTVTSTAQPKGLQVPDHDHAASHSARINSRLLNTPTAPAATKPPKNPTLRQIEDLNTLENLFAPRERPVAMVEFFSTPLFSNDSDDARATLKNELRALRETAGLNGAELTLLAHTLNTIYGKLPRSAEQAKISLTALQRIDLLGAMREIPRDNRATGPRSDSENFTHVDKAWTLAEALNSIPGGIGATLLDKLTPSISRPPNTHDSILEKDRILRNVLLKTTRQLAVEQRTSSRTPSSWFRQPRLSKVISGGGLNWPKNISAGGLNWPGAAGRPIASEEPLTVAEKALLALREEIHELDQHTERSPETPFDRGTHGCRWAISMIRGDMVTDQPKDAMGRPTQYYVANSRLEKAMGKHIDRARKNRKGWTGFVAAVKRHFSVTTDKSPFYSLKANARTASTIHRSGPAQYGAAISGMINALKDQLQASRQMDLRKSANGDTAALARLARTAILSQAQSQNSLKTHFLRPQRLSSENREKIADELMRTLQTSEAVDRRQILAVIDENAQDLTAEVLLTWALQAGGPADRQAVHALAQESDEEPWRAFSKEFQRAENSANAEFSMPSFEGMDRGEIAELMANLVSTEELGSQIAFDNGGTYHFTTKNASTAVSQVGTGTVGFAGQLDLGAGRSRVVRFESGTDTKGSQLKVGVAGVKKGQAGVGVWAGPTFGSVSVGGGAAISRGLEVTTHEGVVLSFPRKTSSGTLDDRVLNARKGDLLRLLINGGELEGHALPGDTEDRGSLI
ncbi:MAG: hypothetical protein KGL39_48530, partial [Patescibacteria group bacterium]|nr:hypothetical protein [Patescibacteria group bacterium]